MARPMCFRANDLVSRRGCISPSGRRLPIIPFFVRSNLIHDRGAGEESTNEKDVNRERNRPTHYKKRI